MNARVWLRENGYDDVADMIDETMREWELRGVATRRNWWDKLAGGKNGAPCKISGRQFPVIGAAQIRQGKEVTANALCRNSDEAIPPRTPQGRWNNR